MSSTITTAANQYANRPTDERMASVADLIASAQAERELSIERTYNWRDLSIRADGSDVVIQSPKAAAPLSHWAFGQMARSLGAPGGYLRTLPPGLAAACLTNGIETAPIGQRASLLLRAPNGKPPMIRACTSDTYARVWDAELYDLIDRQVLQQPSDNGHTWQSAPTWAGESIAGFRSDRDSFLFQVDGGSIVTDPSAGSSGQMYRGLLVRNSEVGAASVSIDMVLFRYVCGNWMLWGAVLGRTFRRRHVGGSVVRDVVREIGTLARQFTQRPASADEDLIKALVSKEIAHTKDGVIDELRAMGLTSTQAADAYARCEQTEGVSPRTYWGAVQGLTRLSQDSGYQDERYALDRLAAAVLARGVKVAA